MALKQLALIFLLITILGLSTGTPLKIQTLSPTSNITCTTTSDCLHVTGPLSSCFRGACICQIGARFDPVRSHCQKIRCSSNADCTAVLLNTSCSAEKRECHCRLGTHADQSSQTCPLSGQLNNLNAFVYLVKSNDDDDGDGDEITQIKNDILRNALKANLFITLVARPSSAAS